MFSSVKSRSSRLPSSTLESSLRRRLFAETTQQRMLV
ncbi:unnamed protein product [Brassica oleracea]|uniref:Uncharacterized protein n=1 Tax=Brassica oleracea TaxID=3712 RepID=A0A3P6FQ63_BRAOL|nr:unnamed protein product [Brassica oleracea]